MLSCARRWPITRLMRCFRVGRASPYGPIIITRPMIWIYHHDTDIPISIERCAGVDWVYSEWKRTLLRAPRYGTRAGVSEWTLDAWR